MKLTAYVEVRSQHSVGNNANGFGGPDTYVAVQVVPDGVKKLTFLNRITARKRGIEIIYCGEGYSRNMKTDRSMLRQAIAEATRIAEEINHPQST